MKNKHHIKLLFYLSFLSQIHSAKISIQKVLNTINDNVDRYFQKPGIKLKYNENKEIIIDFDLKTFVIYLEINKIKTESKNIVQFFSITYDRQILFSIVTAIQDSFHERHYAHYMSILYDLLLIHQDLKYQKSNKEKRGTLIQYIANNQSDYWKENSLIKKITSILNVRYTSGMDPKMAAEEKIASDIPGIPSTIKYDEKDNVDEISCNAFVQYLSKNKLYNNHHMIKSSPPLFNVIAKISQKNRSYFKNIANHSLHDFYNFYTNQYHCEDTVQTYSIMFSPLRHCLIFRTCVPEWYFLINQDTSELNEHSSIIYDPYYILLMRKLINQCNSSSVHGYKFFKLLPKQRDALDALKNSLHYFHKVLTMKQILEQIPPEERKLAQNFFQLEYEYIHRFEVLILKHLIVVSICCICITLVGVYFTRKIKSYNKIG